MGVGRDTCPPRVPDLVPGGWQHGSVMGSWGWGGEASSFLSCPLEKTRQGGRGGDFRTSCRSRRSGELSITQIERQKRCVVPRAGLSGCLSESRAEGLEHSLEWY